MKKIIAFVTFFLLLFSGNVAFGATLSQNNPQIFYSSREVTTSVAKYHEKQVVTFPEKPLPFASKISWKITYNKRWTLVTLEKAYAKIEIIDTTGKEKTVENFLPRKEKTGVLQLEPGQICRVTLYAGRYNNIFPRYGAQLTATCNYQAMKVQVNAAEMNRPGRFQLDVNSIPAADWVWTLPDGKQLSQRTIEQTFPFGLVMLKLTSPRTADSFRVDLEVPDPLEANPGISPTEGYEDLTVFGQARVVNHYQSTSEVTWDFGEGGSPQTGVEAGHIYRRPGTYLAKIKIANSLGAVFEKTWEIKVKPFAIQNHGVVTPAKGPIPHEISFRAEPTVLGTEPTLLEFLWDFGDGYISKEKSGEHVYHEVGDYVIRLSVMDQNHPDLNIHTWTYNVTVTPPVLNLKIDASRRAGVIPCRVDFRSELKVEGAMPDVEYYWDFGDGTYSYLANPSHTFIEPGRYEVRLTVKDLNFGTEVTKTLRIVAEPPTISLAVSANPTSGLIPLKVQFEPRAKIEGGPTNVEYTWDFHDGTYHKTTDLTSVSHTFTKPGTYKVRLTAKDRIYQISDMTEIVIEAKSPEITSKCMVSPLSGNAPLQISGAGNAEVRGYPADLRYSWSVDGQIVSQNKNFSHSLTTPGVHTVTVTVMDTLPGHTGQDSQTWKVNVQASPTPTAQDVNPTKTPGSVVIATSTILVVSSPNPTVTVTTTPKPTPTTQEVNPTKTPGSVVIATSTILVIYSPNPTVTVTTTPKPTVTVTATATVPVSSTPLPTVTATINPTSSPVATEQPVVSPTPGADKIPPKLTVKPYPKRIWPPNQKMMKIMVSITAVDDQDPKPVIRLVAIKCNQKIDPKVDIEGADYGTDDRIFFLKADRDADKQEDRIYLITYSATDRSGNVRMVTEKVVIALKEEDKENEEKEEKPEKEAKIDA